MGSFFILVVIVGGLFAAFLGLRTLTSRRGPTTALVRIGIAGGENEAFMWQQALTHAGIWSRIIGGTGGAYPSIPYQHVLWVKENDAERARDALGIDPEP